MARFTYQKASEEYLDDTNMMVNANTMPADGWVVEMGIRIWKVFPEDTVNYRPLLYVDDRRVHQGSSTALGTNETTRTQAMPAYVVEAGASLRWGFWKTPRASGRRGVYVGLDSGPASLSSLFVTVDSPPAVLGAEWNDGPPLTGYLEYTPNADPLKGTWRTAPSGSVNTVTPLFQGNMLHPASEGGLDSSQAVQLLIFDAAVPSSIYYGANNASFAPTATENSNGYFSRSVTLPASTQCTARFRHQDSWGVWSEWSDDRTFVTAAGPVEPAPLSPTGKINAVSGYPYSALYQHTSAVNVAAAQIRLYSSSGTSPLYDSGEVAVTSAAPGSTVTVNEAALTAGTPANHPALAWATSYRWDSRFKDANGVWGGYSDKQPFRTNAPPAAPSGLSPTANKITSSRAFSANLSDPDPEDTTFTATMELVNATTNAVVAGYPKAMAVSAGVATFAAPASDMVLGTSYKWRARASDGAPNSPGAYSAYSFFTYTSVPTVEMVGPRPNRVNAVLQPSAEHDPVSAYWTETQRSPTNFVDPTVDDNAFRGSYVWRATAAATGDNRFREAGYVAVDATKAHAFYVRARKASGTSATHFAVLCYNDANTLLGALVPGAGEAGAVPGNGPDLPGVWTRVGGLVWPTGSANAPAFPSGTTKIKREFTPSRNSAAVVDFDGFSQDEVPVPSSAAAWVAARDWYGYADGDSPGTGYVWQGARGDSASDVLAVLSSVPASVAIGYSHVSGTAKADDRLILERWDGSAFVPHAQTAYASNGSRVVVPVPSGLVENEGRYRVKVVARDSAAGEGESDWVAFDAGFDAVRELTNFVVSGDPTRGTLTATWDPHALTDEEFAGILIRRYTAAPGEPRPEPPEVVDVIRDPSATSYTYHYPRSGLSYRLEAAVVKNIGAEQVASRYAGRVVAVDYFPFSFLKDTDNPAAYTVAFDTTIENLAAIEEDAPMVAGLPWGQGAYSHDFGAARLRSGEVVAEFHPDALGLEDPETRYEKLRDLVFRRRAICLLSQLPDPEKVFIAVAGPSSRSMLNVVAKSIRFPWQETLWSESYRERNGMDG